MATAVPKTRSEGEKPFGERGRVAGTGYAAAKQAIKKRSEPES